MLRHSHRSVILPALRSHSCMAGFLLFCIGVLVAFLASGTRALLPDMITWRTFTVEALAMCFCFMAFVSVLMPELWPLTLGFGVLASACVLLNCLYCKGSASDRKSFKQVTHFSAACLRALINTLGTSTKPIPATLVTAPVTVWGLIGYMPWELGSVARTLTASVALKHCPNAWTGVSLTTSEKTAITRLSRAHIISRLVYMYQLSLLPLELHESDAQPVQRAAARNNSPAFDIIWLVMNANDDVRSFVRFNSK